MNIDLHPYLFRGLDAADAFDAGCTDIVDDSDRDSNAIVQQSTAVPRQKLFSTLE